MNSAGGNQVTLIGGGMITQIQLLPTLYHLQREGLIGAIHVCAEQGVQLRRLQESALLREGFGGHRFTPHPDPEKVDPEKRMPDLYKQVLAEAPRGSLAVIAVPDHLHYPMIKEALDNDLHVCTVKPLVLKHSEAEELAKLARDRGLVVGIDYHKRFDTRNLMARKAYREGRLGEFKLAQAQMIEPWYYRNSNFQNWATVENSDMFTYVGCHYVDVVAFITGLKPASVSVYGIREKYPNGREGFLWTDGRVIWENGASLSVVDAMGYPDRAAGGNFQGLTMWCAGKDDAGLLVHSDQFRGVTHHYNVSEEPGGKLYATPNPDYFQLIDEGGDGLTPVGYGHRSVEFIIKACVAAGRMKEVAERRAFIDRLDADGIMATPGNSSYNELVIEAGRKSILAGGREVEIRYENSPRVQFREYH